jgi:hypothetical protein
VPDASSNVVPRIIIVVIAAVLLLFSVFGIFTLPRT